MSDLNGAIDDHQTGTYTVTRTQTGVRTRGRYASGASSTFPIVASVQPVMEELQDLPEGTHADDVRILWTATELRPGTNATDPDHIEILGIDYRVEKCQRWDHWGETHYVVTCVKTTVP
jgi:hypothetical protein